MKRINYFVREDQVQQLAALAEQYNISVSELCRRFIDEGIARLGSHDMQTRELTLEALQVQVESQGHRLVALERAIQRLRRQLERS